MSSQPEKGMPGLPAVFPRVRVFFRDSSERVISRLMKITGNDLFLPVLFLLLYGLVNAHLWQARIDEVGDQALIGLQTERASHFLETVGPYSRAGFHHPGPVSFYCYALFDRLLPFIASSDIRYRFAQWILNSVFFIWASILLRRLLPSSRWFSVACAMLLIGSASLDSFFLLSVWGPHILLVSYLLFFVAYLSLLEGRGEFFAAAVSGVFVIHNHVSGVTLIGPLFLVALVRYVMLARAGKLHFGRSQIAGIGAAVFFVIVTSIPPLIDEISGRSTGGGNLSAILSFFAGSGAASRRFDQSLAYLTGYYLDPLRRLMPIPGIAFFAFLSGLPLLAWGHLDIIWRRLYSSLMLVFLLSLLSVLRVSGDLVPHLFWHLYPFVALHYLVFFAAVLSLLPIQLPRPRWLRLHASLTVVALCMIVYRLPSAEVTETRMTKMYEVFKGYRGPYRLVFAFGSKDHDLWVEGAGLALKIVRSGRSYCIDPEWKFMFPPGSVCPDEFDGTAVRLGVVSSEDGKNSRTISSNGINGEKTAGNPQQDSPRQSRERIPGTVAVVSNVRLSIEPMHARDP